MVRAPVLFKIEENSQEYSKKLTLYNCFYIVFKFSINLIKMSDSEDDDQSIRMPIAAYATTNSIQDPHISSTLASDVQMTDDEDGT